MSLIRLILQLFLPKDQEVYDPSVSGWTVEDDHAVALQEDRQRSAFKNMQEQGKTMLQGYKAPDPELEDRVTAHGAKIGWIPPTQLRRRNRLALAKGPQPRRKTG